MPINVADRQSRSFEEIVLPSAASKSVGVIVMKALAQGRIPDDRIISLADALHYPLSLSGVTNAIVGFRSIDELAASIAVVRSLALSSQQCKTFGRWPFLMLSDIATIRRQTNVIPPIRLTTGPSLVGASSPRPVARVSIRDERRLNFRVAPEINRRQRFGWHY